MGIISDVAQKLRGLTSSPITQFNSDETLWKLLNTLIEKSENRKSRVENNWRYWNGDLNNVIATNFFFPDQRSSNLNIVRPITETILKATLDAQFTIAVVADTGSFFDMQAMKDIKAVADILNDELKSIFDRNNIDLLKEQVGRWGEVCGFGVSQTDWTTKKRPDGDVEIRHIESNKCGWNKNAKTGNINYFWHYSEYSPSEAKFLFCRDEEGNYIPELCQKVDEIAESVLEEGDRRQTNSVVNYVNTSNNTAGRAFVEAGTKGIESGRVVKLYTMYLIDSSVYSPEEKDDTQTEQAKQEYIKAFPHGRTVVFSLNEKHKLILKDEPSSKLFKSLGNVDIFNPIISRDLSGESNITDILPIQDRINGLSLKYRECVQNDYDTIFGPASIGNGDNAIVRSGYTPVESFRIDQIPQRVSNGGIERAMQLLVAIDTLKKHAMEVARVNETMLYGARQEGTTSGEQVEALQESPLADIRAQQRNFKDWITGVAEKCLNYIIENYKEQRLIELSTGIDGANMARITSNSETGQRSIELINEANQTIKTIDFNPAWRFKVKCVAGTEIPRTRRESSLLYDKLMMSPIMQSGDLDMIQLYLESQDVPNYRAIMSLLRKKQEEKSKNPTPLLETLVSNPQLMTASANFFKALEGYSKAQGQLLDKLGLDPTTDTLTTAPAQQITSKSQAKDIALIVPQQLSSNPDQIVHGFSEADDERKREHETKMVKGRENAFIQRENAG